MLIDEALIVRVKDLVAAAAALFARTDVAV